MSTDPTAGVDPEALLDRLIDAGVIDERPDGELVATESFESSHAIYRDSYLDIGDDLFVQTVAEAFDLDEDEAGARIEELDVTREELAAYLALQSFLDGSATVLELAMMAGLVAEVDPPSPVPEAQTELDDDSYESFLADHPDAVVFVWKRDCVPCERMKTELDRILEELPEGHASAGIDGGSAGAFRRAFDVTAAPTTLCFADGELVDREEGRLKFGDFADVVARAYDAD